MGLPLFDWARRGAAAFGLLVIAAQPVWADGSAPHGEVGVVRDTDGLAAVEIVIENRTGVAIHCIVSLAHWFSEDLGNIPDGAQRSIAFWQRPATGVLYRLNETAEPMPVEALYCATGNARARLTLPVRVGPIPQRVRTVCRRTASGIACARV